MRLRIKATNPIILFQLVVFFAQMAAESVKIPLIRARVEYPEIILELWVGFVPYSLLLGLREQYSLFKLFQCHKQAPNVQEEMGDCTGGHSRCE